MLDLLRPIVVFFGALTILTGIVYPAVVTAVAQIAFPYQANGSMIYEENRAVGSALIGQNFSQPKYFWGRISATSPVPYNAAASSGSNLGPRHPSLREVAKARRDALKKYPVNGRPPVDLLTASASGLDPHISPAAAEFQMARVAEARKLNPQGVRELIAACTEGRQMGVLGEPRVNVLRLNLALDKMGVGK